MQTTRLDLDSSINLLTRVFGGKPVLRDTRLTLGELTEAEFTLEGRFPDLGLVSYVRDYSDESGRYMIHLSLRPVNQEGNWVSGELEFKRPGWETTYGVYFDPVVEKQ